MDTSPDQNTTITPKRKNPMMDLLMLAGLIGAYFALQLWILPSMGVQT
ncbi:MAG: hypothetical protein JNJ77_11760 [Planctomycetia bacterium]|nr:hypothetical protein [Planctomycetia bacterium]